MNTTGPSEGAYKPAVEPIEDWKSVLFSKRGRFAKGHALEYLKNNGDLLGECLCDHYPSCCGVSILHQIPRVTYNASETECRKMALKITAQAVRAAFTHRTGCIQMILTEFQLEQGAFRRALYDLHWKKIDEVTNRNTGNLLETLRLRVF